MPIPVPAFRRTPPRSLRAYLDPQSTAGRGNTPNNARVGADNEERSPDGLGAARPGRAGLFERRLREERGVADQPQYRPVIDAVDAFEP